MLLGSFVDTVSDVTIRRAIGRFWIQSDQAAVAEPQLGAFGLMVVSTVAATLGVTAIPGPTTNDEDEAWFLWQAII